MHAYALRGGDQRERSTLVSLLKKVLICLKINILHETETDIVPTPQPPAGTYPQQPTGIPNAAYNPPPPYFQPNGSYQSPPYPNYPPQPQPQYQQGPPIGWTNASKSPA